MFIIDNLGTILVALALIGIVSLIVFRLARAKKEGKSIVCSGCKGCAKAGECKGSHTTNKASKN